MMQVMTIRQQIEAALKRFEQRYGYLSIGAMAELYDELHREFGPDAVATTVTAHFHDLAVQMGYVKIEPGKVLVDIIQPKFIEGHLPISTRFEDVIEAMGYVKLAPDAILTTQAEMDCIKRQFAELEGRLEPGKVQVSREAAERLKAFVREQSSFDYGTYTPIVAAYAELTAALEGKP